MREEFYKTDSLLADVEVKLIDFGFLVQGNKVNGQDAIAKRANLKGSMGYFAPELLI